METCWAQSSSPQQSREQCPEYNALMDMHKDLCSALPINDLFPELISRRVITVVDKEKLCLGRVEQERAERFIERHLHPQVSIGETKTFYEFIAAIKESDKCVFLVEKLLQKIDAYQNNGDFNVAGTYTVASYTELIVRSRLTIC